MSRLQTYQVFPAIPEPLKFLEVLARNFWWCWHTDAIELFRRIHPRLWVQSGRNPIVFSSLIPQESLDELSTDEGYLAHLERVQERFENEVAKPVKPDASQYGPRETIAYLSMEFGIHESLPLFAGGLGVLAADHLKAASDLGLPLVGVGLLYRQGYFHQFLNHEGWQQEEYPETELFHLPVSRAKDTSGREVRVSICGPEGEVQAIVWHLRVGRVPLYLLDTNLPENSSEIRDITARLYAGDHKQRLAQEMLLGIGGIKALARMGISPSVCQLNEGHSAFSSLERLAQVMEDHQIDLNSAMEVITRTTIFTTHTPVAAGHDEFAPELVKPYLVPLEERLGITADEILSWGQAEGMDSDAPLSMFVLGLRMSQYHNGVSELHGRVARRMWAHVWPGWPEDEVPITHITNGIHIPSWISFENARLFERYLGPDWELHPGIGESVKRIDDIYDDELWRAREISRSRLIRTCRELMIRQYGRRNAPTTVMHAVEAVLDPDILTIGFARRFAAYKRATLLLRDRERLEAMINSEDRPVQFIFAGKAHPRDKQGKEIIRDLIGFAGRASVRHRIVFLEDYNINITRHLVQGADVWLNTPRRPLEACGTSGMKAAVNGGLNVSILDGWWCEGYSPERGWAIGRGEEHADREYQDSIESQALYNVLENDVIPSFYDRKNGEAPHRWIKMMKASMKMAMEQFCSHRMVREYERVFYLPAVEQYRLVLSKGAEKAKVLLAQRRKLISLWNNIQVQPPAGVGQGPFRVGESFRVTTEVHLGEITPDEVEVELYFGRIKSIDTITASQSQLMAVAEDLENGNYLYTCELDCTSAGRFGFTVRVTPKGDNRLKYTPGLITWA
jgi:starch phosphorylase